MFMRDTERKVHSDNGVSEWNNGDSERSAGREGGKITNTKERETRKNNEDDMISLEEHTSSQ